MEWGVVWSIYLRRFMFSQFSPFNSFQFWESDLNLTTKPDFQYMYVAWDPVNRTSATPKMNQQSVLAYYFSQSIDCLENLLIHDLQSGLCSNIFQLRNCWPRPRCAPAPMVDPRHPWWPSDTKAVVSFFHLHLEQRTCGIKGWVGILGSEPIPWSFPDWARNWSFFHTICMIGGRIEPMFAQNMCQKLAKLKGLMIGLWIEKKNPNHKRLDCLWLIVVN